MDIFLETKRLILRQFTEMDSDFLWNLDNDPRVMKYINSGHSTPKEFIQTKTLPRFIEYYSRYSYFGVWAIVEKATGELIGLTLEKQFRFSEHQLPYLSFEERQAVKYSRGRSEIPPETGFFR